jgi:hypothetical protein
MAAMLSVIIALTVDSKAVGNLEDWLGQNLRI